MQQQFRKKVDKYELNKKQEQKLQNMFEASLVNNYFQAVAPTEYMSKMTAKHFTEKITTNLDVLINEGVLEISKQKKKVEELMDEVKVKDEEIRAEQIKMKKELIQNELRELKRQTSINKSNSEQKIGEGNLVLSKEEHKKWIQKMKKSRVERNQKHHQFLQKIEQKQRQQQQLQKLKMQEQRKQQIRLRRETIMQNLQKHKNEHQQHLKIERESKQKIKQIQHHKFVYQQIEQKYQKSIILPILQQKKKKLKELREYKTLDIQSIKEHEKNYLELKNFQETKRSQVKQDWSYNPPPKSERLESILQEQRLDKIAKEQVKKKALQQKLHRQQNFVSYLKQNFVPKIDPAKEDQIKLRMQKSRIVKPEKADFREIGLAYLEEAKKKRRILKKIEERPQTHQKAVNLTVATATQTKKMRAKSNTDYHTLDIHRDQHYQRIRRRNLQKIAKQEDIPQADRIKQLKHEAEKINEKMLLKQKELKYKKDMKLKEDSLQLLLSSIQAKIGIIQMYQ